MKFIYVFILCCFFQKGFSQSPVLYTDSFSEEITDQQRFSNYTDSISKYTYRDIRIVEAAVAACEKIIDQNIVLSDSLLFDYAIEKIYFMHSMADPLGAYQIIADHEKMLDKEEITSSRKKLFNYLKGFTYMSIGDLEAAQKTYYENLEIAKMDKDTSTIVQVLIALGQLYNDEKDIEEAIQCLQKALDFTKLIETRHSTVALTYIELAEAYIGIEEYEKALSALRSSYKISEKHNLQVLKADVLLLKGEIYLAENKIDSLEYTYNQLLDSGEGSQDQFIIMDTQKTLAKLYTAKKMYSQALRVYKKMLNELNSEHLDKIIDTYAGAHEVCNDMKDFESAYAYLLTYNEMKQKKDEDTKRQKTAYLKIKFESEQKEKENVILTAKVTQNRAERKLLYLWLALSCLILIISFGAFYQKARYSKKLEAEVLKRTIHLKNSNELLNKRNLELDEFNRILSHDLKEPLRSIVGFSQLANRKILDNAKAKEYLDFVIKSGRQLEQLIASVSLFRDTNTIDTEERKVIDIQQILDDAVYDVQENYPDKNISLTCNATSNIIGPTEMFKQIFQIIIDNAAKFNQERAVSVNVSYHLKDQMHFFEFEDNGIGIAPNYHSQIFKMFKRLNNRKAYTGSGMGLSVAQRLLEKIDGKISVLRSRESEGSTFLVNIPELELAEDLNIL